MKKKRYIVPTVNILKMEAVSILASSNGINNEGTKGIVPSDDDDDLPSCSPSLGRSIRGRFSSDSADDAEQ